MKIRVTRSQLRLIIQEAIIQESLWKNVHKKREEGRPPAKPGDEGYPDEKSWKAAQKESDEKDLDEADALDEIDCWDGYSPGAQTGVKTKKGKGGKRVNNCEKIKEADDSVEDVLEEILALLEQDKDRMKCNSPRYLKKGEKGYGKKQKVVKACDDGDESLIKFGDGKMKNKSNVKKNKKSFRARHNCDQKKDKMTAGYWSCKDW